MKFRIVLAALFCTFISANAIAKTLPDSPFPYGLLELRGYAMEMNKDGKFRIYSSDTTFVEGSFKIDGNKMTISDTGGLYACRGKRMNPGIYYWTVHDRALYLVLVKDHCGARRTAFLEAPLKMSSEPE